MKEAIVFLTKNTTKELSEFADEVADKTKKDVIIVSDEEPELCAAAACVSISRNHLEAKCSDSVCRMANLVGCNINSISTHIKKDVIAWDKLFFFFTSKFKSDACPIKFDSYDFVWVFEDDVFFRSANQIRIMSLKYKGADLVSRSHVEEIEPKDWDWHWRSIKQAHRGPYFRSMMCACGISRKLLSLIGERAKPFVGLFHIESMLNTIANENNLKVICAKEFSTIVWKADWTLDKMYQLPDNFFHPFKESRKEARERLLKMVYDNYSAVEDLPKFCFTSQELL